MKRYLCLVIVFLACVLVSAKTLVITLMDDTKVYYTLEEPLSGTTFAPVMVFENGNVMVKGDRYEFVGIKEFRLSEESDPAGINVGTMTFSTDAPVAVYTIDGKKVADAKDMTAMQQLQASHLPKGVYVVKVKRGEGNNGQEVSFKFVKK